MTNLREALARHPRLPLIETATPLHRLERLSRDLGREVWIKRDDTTSLALGGNKVRKLEYLCAEALRSGADTLLTAGAIQSNHVRQTAAIAAQLGLHCHALLENPIGSGDPDYLNNGNRLLLELFAVKVEDVASLDSADEQLQACAERLRSAGRKPFIVPIGGSSALGALGYVRAGLELADQARQLGANFGAVLLASGSAGTQAGLTLALTEALPASTVIGITVSRRANEQQSKVSALIEQTRTLLGSSTAMQPSIHLRDDYFAPCYGEPNVGTLAALQRVARLEGILLDPVYTGKAMAGLLDGVERQSLPDGPLLFLHTGGSPALFAYRQKVVSAQKTGQI